MRTDIAKSKRIDNGLPVLPNNAKCIHEIKGYEHCKGYAICDNGTVLTCKNSVSSIYKFKDKWSTLKHKYKEGGYPFVILSGFNGDVTITSHRLVALAFIPNPRGLRDVNHKNGDKCDNHVSNLEWLSHRDNTLHSIELGLRNTAKGERLPHAILTEEKVREIKKLVGKLTHRQIGEIYNIDPSSISRIRNGKSWAHVI